MTLCSFSSLMTHFLPSPYSSSPSLPPCPKPLSLTFSLSVYSSLPSHILLSHSFSSSLYSLILPYISLTPFLPFLPFLSLHFFLPPSLSSCSLTLFLLRRPLLSAVLRSSHLKCVCV